MSRPDFPSLLYRDPPTGKPIALSVFEDLQLTQLIRSDILEAVLVPCGRENIPLRQELFRAAEKKEFLSHLDALDDALMKTEDLYRAFSEARSEEETAVIGSFLLSSAIGFMRLAAKDVTSSDDKAKENEEGFLYCRFRDFFRAELEKEEWKKAEEELSSLLPLLNEIDTYSFRIHGKVISFRVSGGESYLDRLRACAADLALDPPDEPLFLHRQLSPVILDAFGKAHPEEFGKFRAFYEKNRTLFPVELLSYRLPIGFLLAFTRLFEKVRAHGIPLTYPTLTDERAIRVTEAYDISLFAKNEYDIVPNDIVFTGNEPFFYLTGANGGGKTTYLRTVGIALTLLLLGCPLPCASAVVCVPSGIFTHFPRDERFEGTGRFVEENRRVQKILTEMDEDSVVLLNETYSTTNEENAVEMTEKLADLLWDRKIFGLYITHQHSLKESAIPYLNVLIDETDSNRRTFKIARQRSTGGSFAVDVLKRYALTKEALEERFGSGVL